MEEEGDVIEIREGEFDYGEEEVVEVKKIVEVEEEEDLPKKKKAKKTTTFISGGAEGADFEWAKQVVSHNMVVEIMTFQDHHAHVPSDDPKLCKVIPVSQDALRRVDKILFVASVALKKKIPSKEFTSNYLRRNWYVVNTAEAVFAVGKLIPNGKGLGVDGGTGWACQLYWQNKMNTVRGDMFLFDMATEKWMKCTLAGKWEECSSAPSYSKYSRVALIGSRALTESGLRAIESVFTS